jgi:hypothetical protein
MPLRTRALPKPRKAKSRKAKPKSIPKNRDQENSSPQKEGRRSADKRIHQEPHRKEMRRASFLLPPFYGGTEAQDFIEPWTSWSGRARLSAPHRGTHRGFYPRLGLRPRFLEPPDANGRTLSGTSAASTSRSGTCRTGRCPSRPRAQCIAAPDENRSRSALRSTLAKGVPLRAGFWVGNRYGDESQGQCRFIRDES